MKPTEQEMLEYIEKRYDANTIAVMHSVSRQRVHQWYNNIGLKPFNSNVLTNEVGDRIVELHSNGCTVEEISQNTGIGESTVYKKLYAMRLTPHKTKEKHPITTGMIKLFHDQGLTPDQIKAKFNHRIAKTTIIRRLHDIGLKPNRIRAQDRDSWFM